MPRESTERALTKEEAGETTFYCENRQMEVSLLFCLDAYVDVNALNMRDSQCFKCGQGARIRNRFANS